MLQDEYRQLYKRINKGWEDSVSLYKKLINKQIDKTTVVLDAGCGFSDLLKEEYERCKKVIGVDISPKFLAKNEWVDVKIVANLESIPKIRDNSIDVIVSSWVFEHLKNPNRVFSEFYRILKKGGKLIFLTPNALNGVILLNKMIPSLVRKFLIGKMSKDLETDPMEAFYKANSLMALKRLAKENNFRIEKIILNGDPTYIAVNKIFFYIGVISEKIASLSLLKNFRVHIIGVMERM